MQATDFTIRSALHLLAAHARTAWSRLDRPNVRLVALVGVGYFVTARIGLAFSNVSQGVFPICLPLALLCAVLTLTSPQRWALILTTALVTEFAVQFTTDFSWAFATTEFLYICIVALLAAYTMRRLFSSRTGLRSLRDMTGYLLCIAIGIPLITAVGLALPLAFRSFSQFTLFAGEVCLADILGIASLTTLILATSRAGIPDLTSIRATRVLEGLALAAATVIAGLVSFRKDVASPGHMPVIPLEIASVAVLLWAAVRFGVIGTSAVMLALALIGIGSATMGLGPYLQTNLTATIITFQSRMVLISIPILVLAALLEERATAITTISDSEERYRAFFNLTGVGTIIVDPLNGGFIEVNEGFSDLVGYLREELLTMSFLQLVPTMDCDEVLVNFKRFINGGASSNSVERRCQRSDGTIIWIQIDVSLIRDATGQPLRAMGIVQNITDRKHTEDALQASEQSYMLATAAGHVSVFDLALSSSQLAPDQTLPRWAVSNQEVSLADQGWLTKIHTDDRPAVFAHLSEALKPQAPRDITGNTSVGAIECRLVDQTGNIQWILLRGTVLRNADGEALSIIGTNTDITERKRAEKRVHFQARLLDAVQQGVIATDPYWRVTYWNRFAEKMYGWQTQDALGRDIRDLIPTERPRYYPPSADASRYAFSSNFSTERRLQRRDGTWFPAWITTSPIFDGDTIVGRIGVSIDVTEQKMAEQAAHESESRFQRLAASGMIGIIVSERDGRLVDANSTFLCLLGYSQEALVQGSLYLHKMTPKAGRSKDLAAQAQFEKTGAYQPYEKEYLREDGSRVPVLVGGAEMPGRPDQTIHFVLDLSQRKRDAEEVARLNTRLLNVQDDERRRLARELHDVTAQNVLALTLNLSLLLKKLANTHEEEVITLLEESRTLGEQVMQEIRGFSYVLHPPYLDDAGLAVALRWYVTGFTKRTNIPVDLLISSENRRLDPDIETTLFRIVQECMTNILRHSASRTAHIELKITEEKALLRVKDQGKGMPSTMSDRRGDEDVALGVGILGMRQRVRQFGGRLDISSDSRGTLVKVEIPLRTKGGEL